MKKKVSNPEIGHSVTFLQTVGETNGELLQLAVLALLADGDDPRVPLPVMKGMIAVLAGLGWLAGYREKYPQ